MNKSELTERIEKILGYTPREEQIKALEGVFKEDYEVLKSKLKRYFEINSKNGTFEELRDLIKELKGIAGVEQ